jgi:hypothetical protein
VLGVCLAPAGACGGASNGSSPSPEAGPDGSAADTGHALADGGGGETGEETGSIADGAGLDQTVPPFESGTGQPPGQNPAYPAGPYGVGVGSVIANLRFIGYPAPMVAMTGVVIQLADFYNPSGHGSFTAGSPYGQGPLPLALLVDMGAVWCVPCNMEEKNELPWRWAAMQPAGQILSLLLDGTSPGTPATLNNLTNWDKSYKIAYPTAIDPSYESLQFVPSDSYPGNVIVRTTDMRIMAETNGIPDAPFWETLQSLLPGDAGLVGDASPE